jgi:hypothetical protein
MRIALVVVAAIPSVLVALGSVGCASAGALRDGDDGLDDFAPVAQRLPAPENAVEAQMLLAAAVAALEEDEPRKAARLLDALARSDNLTERGRANVYWLMAEATGQAGDDAALIDALGGFLVAAQVTEGDAIMDDRRAQARAALISAKMRMTPALGTSPALAIPVEDAMVATTVVQRLGCGPRRDMPYVQQRTAETTQAARVLEEHTLTCTDDGRTVTLWFDVTPL